jgi:predicted RNA-binding protein associated with RNAse of E/G family
MPTSVHFEYHRPGKEVTVYREELVLDRPDVKVLFQSGFTGDDVTLAGSVILQRDAPIVWFVPVGSWHDIGRFHLKDGTFTGFYTNVSQPVEIGQEKWIGRDLFLDLWQPIRGEHLWLDEDEFADAVKQGLIDQATRRRVLNERSLIDLQVDSGQWPPAIVRDIDLEQVRALLNT